MRNRRFLETFCSSHVEPAGSNEYLKEAPVSFTEDFESWGGARHCLRFPATCTCTKQSPSSQGRTSILDITGRGAWWGLFQIEWHRRCSAELTSEQILEWDGERAKRHLEIKSRSNTLCVWRQIFMPKKTKREHTSEVQGCTGMSSLLLRYCLLTKWEST